MGAKQIWIQQNRLLIHWLKAFAVYICSIIIMLEVQIAGFIRVQIFIMSSLSLCPISKCMELFFGCSLFQIRTFERFSGPFSELTIGAEYVLVAYTHCSFSGVSLPFYIFCFRLEIPAPIIISLHSFCISQFIGSLFRLC